MASVSLHRWRGVRAVDLDRIAAAHRAVGGSAPGRRWATLQINHAYAVLLSSQFQGFCRDLHSGSVDQMVRSVTPVVLRGTLLVEFVRGRKLDRGNPNSGNIGADFGRLGLAFWDAVRQEDTRNDDRRDRLEQMNAWRNAIAHQDFGRDDLEPPTLTLPTVRHWRRGCDGLAVSFDRVMARYISAIAGSTPW